MLNVQNKEDIAPSAAPLALVHMICSVVLIFFESALKLSVGSIIKNFFFLFLFVGGVPARRASFWATFDMEP